MKKFFIKKNNLTKIIAIFVLLLLIVVYACEEDLWDSILEEKEKAQAIEQAKAWYEANKPETLEFRASSGNGNNGNGNNGNGNNGNGNNGNGNGNNGNGNNGNGNGNNGNGNGNNGNIPMMPEWSNAFSNKNGQYEFVETDLTMQGLIFYLISDCEEKYEETNDPKYRQSYTRIVFRTNRITNETVAFLMTQVPNLEFLEKSKFKPFKKNCYKDRDKNFGGWILFHNLDGSFSNGWVYEKGKITGEISRMDEEPVEMSLRSGNECYWVDYYCYYEVCSDWYTVREDGPDYYSGTTCHIEKYYMYSTYVCPIGGGGGPSSDGGYPGSGGNPPAGNKTPETRIDCPPQAATNSTTVNNVLNSNSGGNAQVKSNVDQLRTYAQTQSNEYGLVVNRDYVNGQYNYTVNQNSNGSYFNVGYTGSVTNIINGNTYMTAHTHTAGGSGCTAPTPNDVINIAKAYAMGYSNVSGSLIFGYDGSEYMIYVNNPNQLSAFANDPYKYLSFYNNGDAFGSDPYLSTYNSAFNSVYNAGFSKNDALSYALSYVLDYYDTGIKIYQKKNGNFKEQKTDKDNNSNYLPKICP